jgi:hypothetical protein
LNQPFQNYEEFEHEGSTADTFTCALPTEDNTPPHGFVYTQLHSSTTPPQPPNDTNTQNQEDTIPPQPRLHNNINQNHIHTTQPRDTNPHFHLAIARPKLDFPTYYGEEPFNWLRQCEKYFSLANVPMENWVSLCTLHCHGVAQTWWRSLRTQAAYIYWTQFCTMLTNIFSAHSSHTSLELFHHLKQTTSVSDYIQKFEEMMALMQTEYPGLTEAYFVCSFIAGLRNGIKHYLIPHSPKTLCDTYWKARELEKGILHKKSLLPTTYTKPATPYNQPKPVVPNQPIHNSQIDRSQSNRER